MPVLANNGIAVLKNLISIDCYVPTLFFDGVSTVEIVMSRNKINVYLNELFSMVTKYKLYLLFDFFFVLTRNKCSLLLSYISVISINICCIKSKIGFFYLYFLTLFFIMSIYYTMIPQSVIIGWQWHFAQRILRTAPCF